MKTATIINHVDRDTSGTIGRTLAARGFEITHLYSNCDDVSTANVADSDILVVMGGSLGVYQAPDYPFIDREIDIIKARLDAEKPLIGICLGAQLMAAALGEKVYPGPNGKELGWFEIEVTPEGMDTPARHFDKSQTRVMQWHGDTFDLPKGAVRLARSEKYENQIYSYGRAAIGLQCHPEVCPRKVEDWLVSDASSVSDGIVDADKVRKNTDIWVDKLMGKTERFLTDWLESVSL